MDFNEEKIIKICSESIIFRNIDKNIIKNFLDLIVYKVIFFKKGQLIIREDEYIDSIWLILSGEVNSCKYSSNGNEILLSKLEDHEVLGLDITCTRSKKSLYDVYASKPSFLLKFDYNLFHREDVLPANYKLLIYENIIECIANNNAKQLHKIEIISQKSIRDKIMTYLLIQKNNKNTNKFEISFDRDQLANYLCINRSVLSHELSLMQQEGLIKFKKNEFEIFE